MQNMLLKCARSVFFCRMENVSLFDKLTTVLFVDSSYYRDKICEIIRRYWELTEVAALCQINRNIYLTIPYRTKSG